MIFLKLLQDDLSLLVWCIIQLVQFMTFQNHCWQWISKTGLQWYSHLNKGLFCKDNRAEENNTATISLYMFTAHPRVCLQWEIGIFAFYSQCDLYQTIFFHSFLVQMQVLLPMACLKHKDLAGTMAMYAYCWMLCSTVCWDMSSKSL